MLGWPEPQPAPRSAEAVGMSHSAISRIERGDARRDVSVSRLGRRGRPSSGLRLSIKAYPVGPPLRDAAQLGLLGSTASAPARVADLAVGESRSRSRATCGHGTLRSRGPGWTVYVDAETRIRDAQALERRTHLKRRDTMHEPRHPAACRHPVQSRGASSAAGPPIGATRSTVARSWRARSRDGPRRQRRRAPLGVDPTRDVRGVHETDPCRVVGASAERASPPGSRDARIDASLRPAGAPEVAWGASHLRSALGKRSHRLMHTRLTRPGIEERTRSGPLSCLRVDR